MQVCRVNWILHSSFCIITLSASPVELEPFHSYCSKHLYGKRVPVTSSINLKFKGREWRKIVYICATYCAPSFCCPFNISLSLFTDCLFISSTFRSRDSNSLSRYSSRWLSDETWKKIRTSVLKDTAQRNWSTAKRLRTIKENGKH